MSIDDAIKVAAEWSVSEWMTRKIIEAYESTKTEQPVDWTEDATHENGNYQCRCLNCNRLFMGHKRRLICKDCSVPTDCRKAFDQWLDNDASPTVMARSKYYTAQEQVLGWLAFQAAWHMREPKRESGEHRLVIIESPYAGNVEANTEYARKCVRDSLLRGEAPIASHLLYTQPGILDDDIPADRQAGIDAGLAWRMVADATVVYTDLGISKGMQYGIEAAKKAGITVEYRVL